MEAIRYYVRGVFQDVKVTPEALEQQDELIADLTAKVGDLVNQGRSEEEALGVAIASLGDLSSLVKEFESAEQVPTTATVQATLLDLHVVMVCAFIGMVVLLGSTLIGVWINLFNEFTRLSFLSLLMVLVAGIWWVGSAHARYESSPQKTEIRSLDTRTGLWRALALWIIIFMISLTVNALTGQEFWAWPLWVAGGTWALTYKVESILMRKARFQTVQEAAFAE